MGEMKRKPRNWESSGRVPVRLPTAQCVSLQGACHPRLAGFGGREAGGSAGVPTKKQRYQAMVDSLEG
ncbi:hypothetical protein LIA77_05717 [Sarocladium implicatum]|nr:hypothetical protein LIA77_05717 [Sarocladium implicatum]